MTHTEAGLEFEYAKTLHRKNVKRYELPGSHGVRYTTYLEKIGQMSYARRIIKKNLKIYYGSYVTAERSQYHRLLGDLETAVGRYPSARRHYSLAVKIAQTISRRDVLVEALLARGRWLAQMKETEAAQSDLAQALNYATTGGYVIYKVDSLVGFAWLALALGNIDTARDKAQRAKNASQEIGYHWGQVDAAEVLAVVEQRKTAEVS